MFMQAIYYLLFIKQFEYFPKLITNFSMFFNLSWIKNSFHWDFKNYFEHANRENKVILDVTVQLLRENQNSNFPDLQDR